MRFVFLRLLSWATRCQPDAPKMPLNVYPLFTTWIRVPVAPVLTVGVLLPR